MFPEAHNHKGKFKLDRAKGEHSAHEHGKAEGGIVGLRGRGLVDQVGLDWVGQWRLPLGQYTAEKGEREMNE